MRHLLALLLLLVLHSPAHAIATLAADVNLGVTDRYGGEPAELTRLGDLSYFRACERSHGCELWQTDGTAAGTVLVADICPGPCSSYPTGLRITFGASLYFSASDGAHGAEPWIHRPDLGTPRMVIDANPGAVGSQPSGFIASSQGNLAGVYFLATVGTANSGANSVFRVQESVGNIAASIALPAGTVSNIGAPVLLGERLFFRALSTALGTGTELWTLHAPGPGQFVATPMRDIFPGSTGAGIDQLTPHPSLGVVFFRASDSSGNAELWKSDGTPAGTVLVKDIRAGSAGSSPAELTVLGLKLFFSADDSGNSIANRELWSSDGTANGTTKVKEIRAGNSGAEPRHLRLLGNRLFFAANDGVHGSELWSSNGTDAGTTLVTDLVAGSEGLAPFDYQFNGAVVSGGFYYLATDTTLYRSDGTPAGTRRVGQELTDVIIGIEGLHAAGDRVLFAVATFAEGRELFGTRVDTPTQLGLVRVIGDQIGHSDPRHMHALPGGDIVLAYDDVDGYEWRRLKPDGTAELLVSLVPGDNPYSPINQPPVRGASGQLWFINNFSELWVTDGSVAGTRLLFDFDTLPVHEGSAACITARGDEVLVLMRSYSPERVSLWKNDGTADGTVALLTPENLPFDTLLSDRSCPFLAGDAIVLGAWRDSIGSELFRSNGTPGNLTLLRDVVPGQDSSYVTLPTRVGAHTYFVASDQGNDGNREVWRTDGTAQGTAMVKDINPGGNAAPHALTAFGNGVVFVANDGNSGFELYRSAGTAASTVRVADLHAGIGSAFAANSSDESSLLAVDGGQVLFAATVDDIGSSGSHLYVSDGTEAGTRRIVPDDTTAPLSPEAPVALRDGGVVFAGYTPEHGRELWFSDGSDAGTLLVSDIVPGPESGGPEHIAASADGALFAADDGVRGREPWRVVLTRASGVFADGFE